MVENNFEKISEYYTDLKHYNDTTDGKRRAGLRIKSTPESEKYSPHRKLDMKKLIDGRLKQMNDFYQDLNEQIRSIQNSHAFSTHLEKCEEKLTEVKSDFDKKQEHLITCLAYITIDLKSAVKIQSITKQGGDAQAKAI